MKTVILGLALMLCATFPVNAQERPLTPSPPDNQRQPERLAPEYHGLNAHCRTVMVLRHGRLERVRKCRD